MYPPENTRSSHQKRIIESEPSRGLLVNSCSCTPVLVRDLVHQNEERPPSRAHITMQHPNNNSNKTIVHCNSVGPEWQNNHHDSFVFGQNQFHRTNSNDKPTLTYQLALDWNFHSSVYFQVQNSSHWLHNCWLTKRKAKSLSLFTNLIEFR